MTSGQNYRVQSTFFRPWTRYPCIIDPNLDTNIHYGLRGLLVPQMLFYSQTHTKLSYHLSHSHLLFKTSQGINFLDKYLNSGRCSKFFNLLAMSRAFCIPAIFFLFCALIINVLVTISLPAIPALDIVRTSFGTGVQPDNTDEGVTQARVSLIFSSIGLALISWSVQFGIW